MSKKKEDKNVRVDPQTYEIINKIAKKTNRKIKAVVTICVEDYWDRI